MNRTQAVVFLLTFLNFACLHASRKSFSTIKNTLNSLHWFQSSSSLFPPSTTQTEMDGFLDASFLLAYAIGLYTSGFLGDRTNPVSLIQVGLVLSSFCLIAFSVGGVLKWHAFEYYLLVWTLNGAVQSTGWPANVAIMGNWFSRKERGMIMGIWSSNASVGNIIGTIMTLIVYGLWGAEQGWIITLMWISGMMIIQTFIISYLKAEPTKETLKAEDDTDMEEMLFVEKKTELEPIDVPGISFLRAWLIPGVIPYALAYACLKSVNYSLFFWLPMYLTNSLQMTDTQADWFSMLYDVGQIVGGVVGGYVSDRASSRTPTVVIMMLVSCLCVGQFENASKMEIAVLLLSAGFFIGGPSSLISTAISADLGTHASLAGNAKALSTVTGIIDGTGSLGAAVAQYAVGSLAQCHNEPPGCHAGNPSCVTKCNWSAVLHLLIINTLLAVLCLTPLLKKDIQRMYANRKTSKP